MAGVRINDLPKFLAEEPDENTQPIIVDDPLNHNEPLVTPLALKVVTSYLPSRKPRVSEYEDESIPHIDITIKEPVWDLSETIFSEQEDTMTDFRGEVINNETITRGRRIINSLSTSKYHAVDFTDDKYLYTALNTKVNVAKFGGYNGKHGVNLESLSQKWIISLEADRRTVKHTTKRGIRKILQNTNDRALRYNRLQHSVFTDIMQAGTVSRRGTWYAMLNR